MGSGKRSPSWSERLKNTHPIGNVTWNPPSTFNLRRILIQVCAGLAATARTEAQVTAYDDNRSAALIPSVVQALEVLIHYVNYEGTSESDKFEGSVCLGWAHWTLGAEAAALSALPVTLNEGVGHLVDEGSAWTLVCAVKAAYVKGR